MKKIILFFLLTIIFTCGWKHDRGIILFNSQPITSENALHNSTHFQRGSRVYYLYIAPKRMKNDYIRVQVSKMTDKAPWGGYEVLRTKDFRLMRDQRYYHTDYFTLHEKGRYIMQVFSTNDFQHPLALSDFFVK